MASITYNALALRPQGTGVQTYIRELLGAMRTVVADDLAAVVQSDAVGSLPPGVTALRRRECSGVRRALESLRPVGATDLVHGLDVDLPIRPKAPTVTTVHDLSVFDVPWTFSRVRSRGERLLVGQALRRADAVIAVSSFTAERIEHHFGISATVVLEGAPPVKAPAAADALTGLRRRLGLPTSFVLHVGSPEPRKDLPTLAEACQRCGVPLVLAGPGTDAAAPALGAIGLGYVAAADLDLLYAAAAAVGYPSRYEGFGLPPLEAMAAGAPVVAADGSSLPEVLADGAILVPIGDIDGWADALDSVVTDAAFRAERIAAGQARVRSLRWEDAALGTAAVYAAVGVATTAR